MITYLTSQNSTIIQDLMKLETLDKHYLITKCTFIYICKYTIVYLFLLCYNYVF